ncbi:hypothetical protein TNCV_4841891 [Trichonephila clavipes]|uniref:Uncharacterized protein n=1 Tax=Trichonephila clavipes TaxID=2585209 RepID=A0A8X6WIM9_TRICX|nr:hypothetical protein TNCV_4841891 [Trichonephila clavipes]
MLVRLSRAPVLSGGLRRKTQLFSGTLYMAASSKTPPHQSKDPQKFKTPLQMPVFPGSSPLCHHTKSEKPSDTTSFHSVLVCHRTSWQKNKGLWSRREKKKREIGMARKRAENREGSLGFPGFVKPVFTKDSKHLGRRKRSLGHLGSVKPVLT